MPPVPRGWLVLDLAAGFWLVEVLVVCCFELEFFWGLGWEEDCCCFVPPPAGAGELLVVVVFFGGLDGVDVELGVEVDVEVVGGGEEVVGGGEEVVVVGVVGGQDSDTLATPAGSVKLEIGAPTGRL